MKEQHTLTIYTEDRFDLLNKIMLVFTRRNIKIESLNISLSEMDDIYKYTILITESSEAVRNVALQIEKIIEVFKCSYHTNEDIVWTQVVLFKIPTNQIMINEKLNDLLRKYNARHLNVDSSYTIFEYTVQETQSINLIKELKEFELVEFIESSRIAIAKSGNGVIKEQNIFE
ncbi:acetolactate synthase-1/3 small subunit [Flavobacterium nitrogenifigens]|uniref:Acetolactate synthase small subunit n=2 Tax=Flavobacterium TaxID=237 RepID=A0A7W7IY65_9FLAO|nr:MULTISPECIES: acetolactate synthase small subunit [Flavobacterium]MBB4802630.1 acetolactate synthase-1/3 small subunit [Flavobacterium nitrogenifigens]MBB6387588.1 acetolactate synthase-1/3 small subunit [Flavobacterium notoginsengisoli]